MSDFGSRKPIHMQNPEIAKAVRSNPSYESFRPNVIHGADYKEMTDRPGVSAMSRIRRYPDGRLDYDWVVNQVIDAIHSLEAHENILPIDAALLTVVFPLKFRKMEPRQADILTQLSNSEKAAVAALVESHLAEELNWNAGQGGGSVPGRSVTRV